MMALSAEIVANLVKLLRGKISVEQFEDWFVPRSWNVHKDDDREAERLAHDVDFALIELEEGRIDEKQFREEALRLIASSTVLETVYCDKVSTHGGSAPVSLAICALSALSTPLVKVL